MSLGRIGALGALLGIGGTLGASLGIAGDNMLRFSLRRLLLGASVPEARTADARKAAFRRKEHLPLRYDLL